MKAFRFATTLTLLGLIPTTSPALESEFRGHIKSQITHGEYTSPDLYATLGPDSTTDGLLDIRPTVELKEDSFSASIHGELLGVSGDQSRSQRKLQSIPNNLTPFSQRLPDDDYRILDLTCEIVDERSSELATRLDRLAFAYNKEEFAISVGRQALTWGSGLTFQVLDPFNPFSPVDTDKDYKIGDDMLLATWQLSSTTNIQFLTVGRRDRLTREVEADASSFAAKLRTAFELAELDLITAAHYGDPFIGMSISYQILEAIFRIDVAYTDDDGSHFSYLANVDRSFTIAERPFYLFVELFHNDFGTDNYSAISPALSSRLIRGELFTVGRDYLSTGLRVQASDRLQLVPLALFNLRDESLFFQFVTILDTSQNSWIQFGVNIPSGPQGSEFGGYPLSPEGTTTPSGPTLLVRGAWFF